MRLRFYSVFFTVTLTRKGGGDIEKIINCVFSSCSTSETGGEEAAGGVQQGEGAQEKEGEVRREGTVQHVSYI